MPQHLLGLWISDHPVKESLMHCTTSSTYETSEVRKAVEEKMHDKSDQHTVEKQLGYPGTENISDTWGLSTVFFISQNYCFVG